MERERLKAPKPPRPMGEWAPYFLSALRPFRKGLSLAAGAMVLDAILTVGRPWPLKVVIDRVLAHRPSRVPFLHHWLDTAPLTRMQILYGACAAMLLIAILTGLLTYCYTRLLGNIGQRFIFALRRTVFAHIQRLSLRFHDRQRTGDLTTRITSDIQAIQDVIQNGTIIFGSNGFLLFAMVTLMLWLDWRFTLAALSVSPLLFWTVFRYTRRIKVATRKARQSTGLMASLAHEALSSIRIVQGLAQEEQLDERFQVRSEGYLNAYLESVRYQARIAPLVDMLAAVGLTLVIWYGSLRVLAGELSTGDVVIFFSYVTSLYTPMKALARFTYLYNRAAVGAERIVEVMRVRSELTDRKGAHLAPPLRGAIEYRNVSFEYERGSPVLSHIQLSIAPGEKLAIVGATGAGKSTLVGLIARFYDPTEGAVHIDGHDIRDYTLQSLREQVGLVLQDSLLFSGTIRENIAFGKPDASDAEIIAAAVTANADEFIGRLPHGYDSRVAERGTTLSGGQKQRIAIARAILRNATILILDEPTTGLDAASEKTVMEALEHATSGRTTLIIAHRLGTVRLADRIIVLERGRIVEEGTHSELLARDGRFARFYRLQMAGPDENEFVPADQVDPRD